MRCDVGLGGLVSVMFRMGVMPVRNVSVMSGLFVIAGFVMLSGFVMVAGGMLVMRSGMLVMFSSFFGHEGLLRVRSGQTSPVNRKYVH